MKRFTTDECIDFVNGVISSSRREEMQIHLEQGCKRCSRAVMLWQRVRRIAQADAKLDPPQDAVRIAKAAFATSNLGRRHGQPSILAEMLFDSFLQPAPQGARSLGAESRQMLYRDDPYQVALQVEAMPGGRGLVVTGQMLDSRYPNDGCRNATVMISKLCCQTVQTVTNQDGEFRAEIDDGDDLDFVFTHSNNKPVMISLRDALGKRSNPSH
jgi:hypothetical protein